MRADQQHSEATSSPRRLEILIQPAEVRGEFVRHSCILRRVDGPDRNDTTLWYELPASLPRIAPDDAEPFLLGGLMDAMGEGRDVHAHGVVSRQLLSNLQEFMVAWSRWLPGAFRMVGLSADTIATDVVPREIPHDTAVTAHTGGIDAMSTLFRHSRELDGHRSRRITAAVVVHGFLVPLDQDEKFRRGFELAQASLRDIGLEAHPLRTNVREATRTLWNHVYEVAMVSALQFLKPLGRSCLINAPKPYEDLTLPRGSNPITDALLSSDSMKVLHDGARFDRLEKTETVSHWPEGLRNLRVCWKGSQLEAHCGWCVECVKTKLAFLALGKEYPASLGAPPTVREILDLEAPTAADLGDFRLILDRCRRDGIRGRWVRALRFRVRFDRHLGKTRHLKWFLLSKLGMA